MQDAKTIMFAIVLFVVLALVALQMISSIRRRNANASLTAALSRAVQECTQNGTLDDMRPPNPVQTAFIVDCIRKFRTENRTPEEFLEYMGFNDPFSKDVLLKSLQEVLPKE